MPLDLDTWKGLYNVFDPTRRLEESDLRLYVSRPGAVAEDVAAAAGRLHDGPDSKSS